MQDNDKAFLVGLIGVVLILIQWSNHNAANQVLMNKVYSLESENKELQIKLDSFREGVLSR